MGFVRESDDERGFVSLMMKGVLFTLEWRFHGAKGNRFLVGAYGSQQ